MTIKGSSSAQVARLIEGLLSTDIVARETAAARLAIVGPRAVDRLLATLDGLRRPDQVVAVLDVLERIADPRPAAAVFNRLDDADAAVAVAAAGVVRVALRAEDPETAAEATSALLRVAMDERRPDPVRSVAFSALHDLPADVLEPLRKRWPELDPSTAPDCSQARGRPADAGRAASKSSPRDARVEGAGVPAAAPLGGASAGEGVSQSLVSSHAGAGVESSTPTEDTLRSWIDTGQPESPVDAVRTALHRFAALLPLPSLHRCVDRLRALEAAAPPDLAVEWRTARGAVHQVLAERASRVALYDLREMVERVPDSMTVSMLGALQTLADASCLEAIATGWERARNEWVRPQLQQVFESVIAREHLTRRHAIVKRLATRHGSLVDKVLSTLSQTTPSRSRAGRT